MLMGMRPAVLRGAREVLVAELVSRIDEKSQKMKRLVSLVKRLRNENARLKNRLSAREVSAQREQEPEPEPEPEESRLSKLKGFILEKFFS
ncbi:hypothetical protein NL676_038131 [Syzygium grande]|nr:hypothetical protein NL676_038131 [Syzygium grande]